MAALGWRVFPLAPRSKVPLHASPHPKGSAARARCRGRTTVDQFAATGEVGASLADHVPCLLDGHGCWDATTDEAVIAGWWARTPRANVGVATGRLDWVDPGSLSSPDVVDIDVKVNKQGVPTPGEASLERLRVAGLVAGPDAIVSTASGGWHLYFAGSAQGNSTLRGLGVDFRSLGGYVVAPPSVVDFEQVDWLEQPDGSRVRVRTCHVERTYGWSRLFGMADPRPVDWAAIKRHLMPPSPYPPRSPMQPHPAGTFGGLVAWLADQAEGNRNAALSWAVYRALEGGADDSVVREMEWVGRRLGLEREEIRATIKSAYKKHRGESADGPADGSSTGEQTDGGGAS